ncbi:HNH endonuclease [Devosia rhodophyticola]|uniref:Putative HNH nuclease YajD n=1 Tax=Devosia rhodophyticola TaxID=3026423 RepID=A0ABY7Z1Z4_9HYPH|nr:HNH endonuclease [Devosia rhodophyticola]WDR07303.1 HNH endonuclease [Devosia rhodophyticola]
MPTRAPRVCQCGKVHPSDERCPLAIARDKERRTRHDAKRPSSRQRGYTKEWEAASKVFLQVYPTCRRCSAPAALVDHIKPHKGDQALFWDRSNWQPLCAHCHNSHKQRQERKTTRSI